MYQQKITDYNNLPLLESKTSRRHFLKAGIGVCTALVLPSVSAKRMNVGERKLAFLNLHTGERIKSVYWAEGNYIPEELNTIKNLLRDHRTGELHIIDARLLDLLHLLQSKLEVYKEFHVISAYRSPKTNAMLAERNNGVVKKSLHMQGKAIDIRLPGSSLANLRKVALSLKVGGVGYYPKSNFVHVDTGRVRYW